MFVGVLATLLILIRNFRYTEINDYSFSSGRTINGKAIGHFTQLVWDDTTHVGMGIATKQSGPYWITYIVAKYSPPGNYRGQYTSHVHGLKPGGRFQWDGISFENFYFYIWSTQFWMLSVSQLKPVNGIAVYINWLASVLWNHCL